jgi:hypothetical protein
MIRLIFFCVYMQAMNGALNRHPYSDTLNRFIPTKSNALASRNNSAVNMKFAG